MTVSEDAAAKEGTAPAPVPPPPPPPQAASKKAALAAKAKFLSIRMMTSESVE